MHKAMKLLGLFRYTSTILQLLKTSDILMLAIRDVTRMYTNSYIKMDEVLQHL